MNTNVLKRRDIYLDKLKAFQDTEAVFYQSRLLR